MMEDKNKKNWGWGDILGRSKDGFLPVNTEERDGLVGDDSDSEVSHDDSDADIDGDDDLMMICFLLWSDEKAA